MSSLLFFLGSTSVTLDITLITGVVGLITLTISTIWSFFQMKQKLEDEIEVLRNQILENHEANYQLRQDVYYAVVALQSRTEDVEHFLARDDQDPRFSLRSQNSSLSPRDYIKYSIKNNS